MKNRNSLIKRYIKFIQFQVEKAVHTKSNKGMKFAPVQMLYRIASILTCLGNTKPSHIKLGINSCRAKSIANSISLFKIFVLSLVIIFNGQFLFAQASGTMKEIADQGNKKVLERVGTVTLTMQGGVQNVTNFLENPKTGEQRTIVIDDFGSPIFSFILSLRFGTMVEGWDNINDGFRYNRSNRGFFTDVEFGVKTYSLGSAETESFASYPLQFTINHTGGPNTLGPNKDGLDIDGNPITTQVITLGKRKEIGDQTINLFPWQDIDETCTEECLPVDDPTLYTDNDYINILGIDTEDQNVRDMLESHGVAATKTMTIFVNSYYHFNLFHRIFGLVGLNLGTFFDSSIGVSFRLNRYVDFADFNRFVSYNSDNFDAVIGVISRNYFNFGKKFRLKVSVMLPVVGFLANRAQSEEFNQEEYLGELAVEYYAMPFVYVSAGFQYSYFPYNKNHAYYTIRTEPEGGDAEQVPGIRDVGRGITFQPGQYNYGFNQTRRDSWEAYISVSLDVNLSSGK